MRTIVSTAILFASLAAGASAQSIPRDAAAFTDYMATVLRAAASPASVTVKGPLTLSVGSLQANLDRIFWFCGKNESACPAETQRYAKAVAEVLVAQNAPIDRSAVRLVIRNSAYIQRAQATLGPDAPSLQFRPLADGLAVVAVLDTPQALRPLDTRDLAKLDVTPDQLFALAGDNLRRTLPPLLERAKPVVHGQIGSLNSDVYELGRIALLADWAPLAAAQQGTLLVAMPTTDSLLYSADASAAGVEALRLQVNAMAQRAANPLSNAILRWTPEGWVIVPLR